MSLESQLHDKADKQLAAAYSKLFADFEAGLVALIGRPFYDGHGRPLEQTNNQPPRSRAMSYILDQLLDDERTDDCAAMLPMRQFRVRIGSRGDPRISMDVMAPDSVTAVQQHMCLAEVGERCEVEAARS